MDRDEAIKLLRGGEDGVKEWNRRRYKGAEIPDLNDAQLIESDLRGANLSGANLNRANLSDSHLGRAYFIMAGLSHAKLNHAELSHANLSDADLTGAHLMEADLSDANLSRARLAYAKLRCSKLVGTNLTSADLTGADLDAADLADAIAVSTGFSNLNLSVATSLEKVRHFGPSFLGIETVIKSGGKIPEAFLAGCGVPDNWITYLPSLLGKPIDFYSCFISYSYQNEEFTRRLHSRMREDHFRVWYAPEDIKGGRKIHEQIDSAIKLHDKLLVVLSKQSMKSEWVKTEIWHARQREVKEGKRVLFPIRLVSMEAIKKWEAFDEETGKDMAREIRSYFIPDFTNWKDHDAFEASYQRLMKDFKPSPDDG